MARSFAKLMFEGKVRPAIRLLSDHSRGGRLSLENLVPGSANESRTVQEVLLGKHPEAQSLKKSAVVNEDDSTWTPHPILYEQINGPLIHSMALRTNGTAGPSGIDAAGWRRLLSSFRNYRSADLCEAVAMVARRICQQFVDPTGLDAFTACRLVALDKCPGVRPIGIGEVVRRIIGKAVLAVTGPHVREVTGALQVCAGQRGGSEAAVHAMRHVFQDTNTEAVLLVDATNAFNSLNRQVALQNVLHLCPSIAPAIVNTYTYRADAQLFVDGEVIYSSEGTTQGDPLAMVMYAIATLPLIHKLDELSQVKYIQLILVCMHGGGRVYQQMHTVLTLLTTYFLCTWYISAGDHVLEACSIENHVSSTEVSF